MEVIHLELFSEVYGRYYSVLTNLLTVASLRPVTTRDVNELILREGFAESLAGLGPKLLESGPESYNLLIREDTAYKSALKGAPAKMLTTPQKMWLKALLSDSRIGLFLDKADISQLDAAMYEIKPLFDDRYVETVDMSRDGDPFEDPDYRAHFRTVLSGVQHKQCLEIRYHNAEGKRIQGDFVPYRLEYSLKDDKFRLSCIKLENGRLKHYTRINLFRIEGVEVLDRPAYPEGVERYISRHKMPEPIEIEVSNERNGFERCFIHLSNFERSSEYIKETDTCRIRIFYYDFDEPELIITLLSFGPILKVLSPAAFRNQLVERIKRQMRLLEMPRPE
ncbi:MAG TPA: WYL domain-containing protein [Bacillota bacterium]|nr:WYL domain-containing protein [Bacillota bacterium]